MEFYNDHIQLDKVVIGDILSQCTADTRMLVFGLGHDSRMWYAATQGNTYFVEDNPEYIDLNTPFIPRDHIVHYQYGTTCATCPRLTDADLERFTVPESLQALAPFDIILIDGPTGWNDQQPGRMIPCFWAASSLSRPGTLVYVDDADRPLEAFLIKKFFQDHVQQVFPERGTCVKVRV